MAATARVCGFPDCAVRPRTGSRCARHPESRGSAVGTRGAVSKDALRRQAIAVDETSHQNLLAAAPLGKKLTASQRDEVAGGRSGTKENWEVFPPTLTRFEAEPPLAAGQWITNGHYALPAGAAPDLAKILEDPSVSAVRGRRHGNGARFEPVEPRPDVAAALAGAVNSPAGVIRSGVRDDGEGVVVLDGDAGEVSVNAVYWDYVARSTAQADTWSHGGGSAPLVRRDADGTVTAFVMPARARRS